MKNNMKNKLMLISGMSTHLMGVYNVLHSSNINVVHADNAYDAKAELAIHSPAFVLLNFNIKGAKFLLKDISLGQWFPKPYVMVAANYSDGSDRADMLRHGADICIDWPINVDEVLAVIHAVRRRSGDLSKIEYKELSVNTIHRIVTMRGKPVALTRKEYEVLILLANHTGTVLTKEEIYRAVWKSHYDSNSTNVADQISSLRSKLGLTCKDTTYIQTVIGVGYRFGELRSCIHKRLSKVWK